MAEKESGTGRYAPRFNMALQVIERVNYYMNIANARGDEVRSGNYFLLSKYLSALETIFGELIGLMYEKKRVKFEERFRDLNRRINNYFTLVNNGLESESMFNIKRLVNDIWELHKDLMIQAQVQGMGIPADKIKSKKKELEDYLIGEEIT